MKTLIIALAVGLLVGAIYGLLNVRSPAPPYVALLGLLGILLGEQGVQHLRHRLEASQAAAASPDQSLP
ncbi:XapX domain-containing protein [Brevundimonas sp. Root1423]|uniref:XapX domain-containing protein n=1 Tax=Brevundimonas sp. Root1423 TaxID=1736462 RepID=UPI000A79C3C4|nr:DUF1427 family protein [Brevundimonas sp. Root1423]